MTEDQNAYLAAIKTYMAAIENSAPTDAEIDAHLTKLDELSDKLTMEERVEVFSEFDKSASY